MKRLVVLLTCLTLTACASSVPRAGSIAVSRFATDRYTTNDSATVTWGVVDDISQASHRAMIEQIRKETRLNIARDCSSGDYELTGYVSRVKSESRSRWSWYRFVLRQRYRLVLKAELRRCSTGEVLRQVRASGTGEDLDQLVTDTSREIVRAIGRVKR